MWWTNDFRITWRQLDPLQGAKSRIHDDCTAGMAISQDFLYYLVFFWLRRRLVPLQHRICHCQGTRLGGKRNAGLVICQELSCYVHVWFPWFSWWFPRFSWWFPRFSWWFPRFSWWFSWRDEYGLWQHEWSWSTSISESQSAVTSKLVWGKLFVCVCFFFPVMPVLFFLGVLFFLAACQAVKMWTECRMRIYREIWFW